MKTPTRPVSLMTLAQVILVLIILVTLFFTFTPALVLVQTIQNADVLLHDSSLGVDLSGALYCLRDAILGACRVCAEMEAIGVCGRVKKSSAFSEKNVSALGRIALALTLAGLLTLFFGESLVAFLLMGMPPIHPAVQRLLLPFMLLGVALMIRTVQVLMRRAVDMQAESDLTV